MNYVSPMWGVSKLLPSKSHVAHGKVIVPLCKIKQGEIVVEIATFIKADIETLKNGQSEKPSQ